MRADPSLSQDRRIDLGFTCLGALLCLVLASCGGGGGGDSTPAAPTVTLSGTATFSRVPTSGSGLNYAAIATQPIRKAVVQVRNAAGTTVLYQSSTDASGNWSIAAPQSTSILVVVLAELGTPSAITTKVVDSSQADAVYSVYLAKTTSTTDETSISIN